MIQQTALKYDVEVKEDGRVELSVPFPAGAHLVVFVIQADEAFNDLLMAAESSLDFWGNPWDDEEWNTASINSYQNLRAGQFGNTGSSSSNAARFDCQETVAEAHCLTPPPSPASAAR